MNPWLVVLIGVGTVFAGLVMLIIAIKIMTLCIGLGRKKEDTELKSPAPAETAVPTPQMPHDKLVAVASAAIAEYIGNDAEGLRILSVKPVGSVQQDMSDVRLRNVAIAAAIAEAIGTSPEGLRILSVKKI